MPIQDDTNAIHLHLTSAENKGCGGLAKRLRWEGRWGEGGTEGLGMGPNSCGDCGNTSGLSTVSKQRRKHRDRKRCAQHWLSNSTDPPAMVNTLLKRVPFWVSEARLLGTSCFFSAHLGNPIGPPESKRATSLEGLTEVAQTGVVIAPQTMIVVKTVAQERPRVPKSAQECPRVHKSSQKLPRTLFP